MTQLNRLLAEAAAAGIDIVVDGVELILTAPAQPSTAIVEKLARHKGQIIAALRTTPKDWTQEDWQALFDERAAIMEFDGGSSRAEAEARAFETVVAEWLRQHPVRRSSRGCLGCGGTTISDEYLEVGGNQVGAWLHSRCWPEWRARREAEAVDALAKVGVTRPASV